MAWKQWFSNIHGKTCSKKIPVESVGGHEAAPPRSEE